MKFKLRTTILLLSQVVFLIFLAGCGGGEAPLSDCDFVKLDVQGHTIEISEFIDQSEAFLNRITYYDRESSENANFLRPQMETLESWQITNLLSEYKRKLIIDETYPNLEKRIIGIRIYFTFDILNKKIKLYYAPDITSEPIDKENGIYEFNFSDRYDDLLDAIRNRIPIYEAFEGRLTDLSGDDSKLELASQQWNDYKSLIKFYDYSYSIARGIRPFNLKEDATSVFFPEKLIKELSLVSSTNLFVVSGIKPDESTYRHTINFGTIPPRIKEESTDFAEEGFRIFIGRAANLGQLCPSKCTHFEARRIHDCTFEIVRD